MGMEQQWPDRPGVHRRILKTGPSSELRVTLSIPPGDAPERPCPLVLALHYGWDRPGRPPRFYGKSFLAGLIEPALAELGAILVAPDCPGRDWADPGSEAALMGLLELLRESYSIDGSRILITGYSLGGMGSWHMAAAHPGLFSAAIPIAGWPPEGALGRIEGVPLYLIHSRDDEVIPIEPTVAAVRQLEARGIRVEFVVLKGVSHFETGSFVEPLRAAIPWIRAVWEETDRSGSG